MDDVSVGGGVEPVGVTGDDEEGGRTLTGVATVPGTLPTAPVAGAWSRVLILLCYFCKS